MYKRFYLWLHNSASKDNSALNDYLVIPPDIDTYASTGWASEHLAVGFKMSYNE